MAGRVYLRVGTTTIGALERGVNATAHRRLYLDKFCSTLSYRRTCE
jgi:hypothetical protein